MSRICDDLQRVLKGESEKVPDRFKTADQIAKEEKKDKSWAKRAVRKLVDARLWEEKSFRILTKQGLRPVPHYGPKARG